MMIKELVGSGHKVARVALPFLAAGLALNIWSPAIFSVGGPSPVLRSISAAVMVIGIVVWLWSGILILTKAPKGELITRGPFAVVKHPLYTGVALLVLPWLGFIFNTWLGVIVGIALYAGSRLYSPEEERALSKTYGAAWENYSGKVMIPWL